MGGFAQGGARAGAGRKADGWTPDRIKARIVERVAAGVTIADALREIGRSRSTYEAYRRDDQAFAVRVDKAKQSAARGFAPDKRLVPDFPEFCEKYLGQKLFPHQMQWLDILEGREPRGLHPSMDYRAGRVSRLMINTPPGHAKALALDTPLPTPTGWTTMGEVQPGDWLLGRDGSPVRVSNTSPVFVGHGCFRVWFEGGESIVADAGHRWLVEKRSTRRSEVLTTADLAADPQDTFYVALADELQLPEAPLPLDPYLLGVWLGDGHTASGRFTTADPEIVAAFDAAGFQPRLYAHYGYETTGLSRRLRGLGLIGQKYAPEGYLYASAPQRLAFLQGLMDSDGTVQSGGRQVSFCNTNRDLIDAVVFLAASLGMKPSVETTTTAWRVSWCPGDTQVFRLPRKAGKVILAGRRKKRRIVAVQPVESVPTKCVTVDHPDEMFLAGWHCIPTKNSTTVTVNFVVWRIIRNPGIKVLVVSKAQKLAEQFLLQIKERLTSPQYQLLIDDFAPPGGWDSDSAGWSAGRFYVSGKVRGAEAKDPTVQAVGIRGQVYGSRADVIVLDDCVDNTNVADFEKQISWVLGIVSSRLAPRTGKCLVIGTRIAPRDLYMELQEPSRYHGGRSPWTYLRQPAVLEYAESPKDWVTLWPRSDVGADPDELPGDDGLYARWDGPTLAEVRDAMPAGEWSRLYMQEQVSEDAYFTPALIASVTRGSPPGLIPDGVGSGRDGGMSGLRLIAGLDPAMSGYTSAVLVGLDPQTRKRWVVDVHNQAAMKPDEIRSLIRGWTERYRVQEWRIENNAFQAFLTQDREVRDYLASRGVVLAAHHTGRNKTDPQFGVAAMTMLFEQGLVSLPTPRGEAVRQLREQLITWSPDQAQSKHALKGHKTDLVMALWFAELRCLELVAREGGGTHAVSPFHTRRDRARQFVVPFDEAEAAGAWV